VALHAADLGFVHPVTGEELNFSSPLPADIVRLIKRLRGLSAGRRGIGGDGSRIAPAGPTSPRSATGFPAERQPAPPPAAIDGAAPDADADASGDDDHLDDE